MSGELKHSDSKVTLDMSCPSCAANGPFMFVCVFMPAAEQSSQVMTQLSDPQTADPDREQVCPDMVLHPTSLHSQVIRKDHQRKNSEQITW